MRRWRSWNFGRIAESLPVERCAEEWFRSCGGRLLHHSTNARRAPSGAVPESLERLLASPSEYLVRKRKNWDIVKYARLYTGETYSLPPCFEFSVRDAWLHVPSGFVITPDKRVLAFSSYSLPSLYKGHAETDLESAPVVERVAFKLCTAWGHNYAHWLMDGFPKVEPLHSSEERLLVLDKPSPSFQVDSLALLGLRNVFHPKTELLKFREIHFVSTGRSGVPDPRALLRLRDRLIAGAGPASGPRRIYVSRQRTRRKILNGQEVARVLSDFGFEEVFAEELDFAAQVRLFSGCEAIFGAHGAGTMNALFAPAGAALIEAFNPPVWDHAAHRVASLCGVRHYHLFCENASRDFDVRIDTRVLERTLALALDDPSSPRLLLVEGKF